MTTIIGEDNLRIEQCERFLKSKRMLCPPVERWSQILEFSSVGDKVKIVIDNGEEETIFEFINVSLFDFSIFTDFALVGKTNIKKEGDNYVYEVDVPGISKDDVQVNYEDGYLIIEVTNKQRYSNSSDNYIRQERYVGSCSRSYYVGEVDESKISAKYNNGVLCISVPSSEKDKKYKTKSINIQ